MRRIQVYEHHLRHGQVFLVRRDPYGPSTSLWSSHFHLGARVGDRVARVERAQEIAERADLSHTRELLTLEPLYLSNGRFVVVLGLDAPIEPGYDGRPIDQYDDAGLLVVRDGQILRSQS